MIKRIFLLTLAMVASASASVLLVADPVAANDPSAPIVSYTIQGLPSVNLSVPATVNPDGSFQLRYDLSSLNNGSYTVTAVAVNKWGASAASVPFTFSKSQPGTPTGLKLL